MLRSFFVILLMLYEVIGTSAHAQTPATSNWSGSYVGGSLGVANNVSDTKASTPIGGGSSYFTSPDDVQIAGAGHGSFSQSRLSGGIFGGWQKLYGSALIGVEASANSLSFDESRSRTVTYTSAPTAQFTLRQSATADWQGTLRLRLGYAQADWLAYVTGGAAVAQIKVKTSFSDDYVLGASGQGSNSETKVGWILGAGGEYAMNKNWSIRGEYLYSDFGSVDAKAVVTNPFFPSLSNTLSSSVKLKTQVLSIGMVYRFP
jgi:opacity protein-like surface antigen